MTAPIVVFDGECGLCNGFVAWLVRHDRKAVHRLAGSNGDVGRAAIATCGLPADIGRSTIVLALPGGRSLIRSDAVLAILAALPWPWRWVRAGRVVPRNWRDRIYAAVAARRPRVNAEDPACGVPPASLVKAWRDRLATLDNIAALTATQAGPDPTKN